MRPATLAKLERFVEAWGEAESLRHAHEVAETGITDERTQRRFRRKAETHFGIVLEPHNPEFSTDKDIECPSSLDVSAARSFKKFVITSHTNNSPIEPEFFESLKKFAEHHEAQLIVVPVRYKNPNSVTRNEDYHWDPEVYPYVLKDTLRIGRNFVINGGVRIEATAINPLSSMEELSYGRNAVYGHPQIAMQPIPTPKDEMTRFMHTTGSVNKGRYSSSKKGGKAQFHHSLGALFVQVVGDFHYPMQLNWSGSGFHYMNQYWGSDGFEEAEPALGLVSGDIHADWEDLKNTRQKNKLMDMLNVDAHVLHDLHNHTRGSHHNTTREKVEMALRGEVLVEEEMYKSIDYVKRTARNKNLIVGSNHNDHADKWLDKFKAWEDPHNAPFASWLQSHMYGTEMAALETFFHFHEDTEDLNYEFIAREKPYLIGQIDVSQHGDKGPNGAFGSTAGFAKTCRKIAHGHSHTPRIVKGAYSSGHSFDASHARYADSYSTWAQADIIIYADGKRSHFFYGPHANPPQLR